MGRRFESCRAHQTSSQNFITKRAFVRDVHRFFLRISRLFTAVLVWFLLASGAASAQDFRYSPVSQDIVESRLKMYAGSDQQRESSLKQMFADAGCSQQLSEQPVKGAKQPNLICVLPGRSSRLIVVGAHFDHVSAGDGVVDNWSGA